MGKTHFKEMIAETESRDYTSMTYLSINHKSSLKDHIIKFKSRTSHARLTPK